MKRWLLIGGGIICAAAFSAILAIGVSWPGNHRGSSKSTHTHSAQLADDRAKIDFAQRYLRMHSAINAAEFDIRYEDRERERLPSPAEWDLQIVMKMDPAQVASWTADVAQTSESVDLDWAYALLPSEPRWTIQSTPVIYARGNTVVAVFEREGIVFKRTFQY